MNLASLQAFHFLRYNKGMHRDNQTWLADLRENSKHRESALNDMREILMRILPKALSRWLSPNDPHFEALLEDIVQETLIRVLDRLNTFEGRSKFTTWVYTIAIRIGLSELRLNKWKEVSLDALEDSDEPDQMPFNKFTAPRTSPESSLAQKKALELVMRVIEQELTPHQRAVMEAVIFQRVPMEVIAERMNTNRNALYKAMHDARLKLKRQLEKQGHSPEKLLKVFSD